MSSLTDYPARPEFHGLADLPAIVLGRLMDADETLLTVAKVSAIAYKVYDLDADALTLTGSGALAAATSIFDVPLTTYGWPHADGYNFRATIPATCFPNGNHLYQVEVTWTTALGNGAAIWRFYGESLLGG